MTLNTILDPVLANRYRDSLGRMNLGAFRAVVASGRKIPPPKCDACHKAPGAVAFWYDSHKHGLCAACRESVVALFQSVTMIHGRTPDGVTWYRVVA